MKIWHRYFLKQFASTFFFLLFCIFTVYVLVDLSIHGVRFIYKSSVEALDLFLYYLHHFAMHLELFLPLTFLLSTLKVLFDLNSHLELVALQMAGLSRKKLLLPFFAFASFLSLVCYVNSQWLAPSATFAAKTFDSSYGKKKKRGKGQHVQAIALSDDSELVYQLYDEKKQELFDVFWVRSNSDIWHMKTLQINPPIGYFVDHFQRKKLLEKTESFDQKTFDDLPLTVETAPKPFVPFESRSLTTLLREAIYDSSERAMVRTHLHYKIALPLLPLLLLFTIAPSTLLFSRNRPTFLIVATSLFGFISLMIIYDSLLILGENQVLAPWLAMWLPFALILAFSLRKFARL